MCGGGIMYASQAGLCACAVNCGSLSLVFVVNILRVSVVNTVSVCEYRKWVCGNIV